MPHFRASVRSPWSAEHAYDYLADLEHFEEWDPGTVRAVRVTPDAYDITVKTFGRELILRYDVVNAEPPSHLRLVAETGTLRLVDEIAITEADVGCIVTYDATLSLKGPLALLGPLFAPGFKRTVNRGAAGLRTALEGVPRVTDVATLLDGALELPIIPSFTKLGYLARRRLFHWTPLDRYDLRGRVITITGATSGIGRDAAAQLAHDGATLVLVGRDEIRNQRVAAALRADTENDEISTATADLGDLDAVRHAADTILDRHDRLDVLIHNAGALTKDRHEAPDGTEATVAAQVVGPFLLTSLLLDRLVESAPARVITMSSGGMYTAPLTVDDLQMDAPHYKGAEQYARAKRAQVTLNALWAERIPARDVVFHALHPGWADTPGVVASLPTFHKVMGPLLRTPEEAADTLTWLAADDGDPLQRSGGFWLDRRVRPIHRLPATRRSDTPERRAALWDWVVATSGAPVTGASASTR